MRRVPLASPAGLALSSLVLVAAFAVVHALGWREATCALSGTLPDGLGEGAAATRAVLYVAAWAGAVGIAPILAVAALVDALLVVLGTRRSS